MKNKNSNGYNFIIDDGLRGRFVNTRSKYEEHREKMFLKVSSKSDYKGGHHIK